MSKVREKIHFFIPSIILSSKPLFFKRTMRFRHYLDLGCCGKLECEWELESRCIPERH